MSYKNTKDKTIKSENEVRHLKAKILEILYGKINFSETKILVGEQSNIH